MSYLIKSILLLDNNKIYNIIVEHTENKYLYKFSFNYTSENKVKLNNFLSEIRISNQGTLKIQQENITIEFRNNILSLESNNTLFLVQITCENLIEVIKVL
jgi:hypothetical protein